MLLVPRVTSAERWELDDRDPINRGLLGLWPLDEAGGAVARDLSPYRRDAIGGGGIGPTRVATPKGRAAAFAGPSGVNTNNFNLGAKSDLSDLQVPVSMTAWIYPTTVTGFRPIIGQYGAFIAGWLIKLLRIDNGTLVYYSTSNSGTFRSGGALSIAANTWSFVSVVVSGSVASPVVTLGRDMATNVPSWGALRSSVQPGIATYLGTHQETLNGGGAEGFAGRMVGVRIWSRAIRASERIRLYREPWAGAIAPGERLFHAVKRSGGASNDATITGTVPITASLSATLGLAAVISGTVPVTGSAAAAMALAAQIAGLVPVTGEITATFPNSARIAGTVPVTAQITATFPNTAIITGTIPVTAQITASTGSQDAHDGFARRSRREKRIAAAQARTQAERLADAQALRLALEAALGVVAEVPAPAMPVAVAKAVDAAPKPAEVDWRKVAEEPAEYVRLAARVQRLVAAVQSATDRRRELAEDDEEVAFVLGMI